MENEAQEPEEKELSEAEMLRREGFAEVGKLPLDYRTHLIIVAPNGSVTMRADEFALYELLGLLEMSLLQVRMMMMQQPPPPDRSPDDGQIM